MERKDYILTNATQLFNQQGATSTSLRQLATHLDMSDGNLRYHFKNKEELVTAVFMQMLAEMSELMQAEIADSSMFPDGLRKQLRTIFFTMYRYKFLFIESTLLLNQYPSFRKAFLRLVKARKTFFLNIFKDYRKRGFFNEAYGAGYSNMLVEQIFIISDNWIKYVALEEPSSPLSIDAHIDHYVDLCVGLLRPLSSA